MRFRSFHDFLEPPPLYAGDLFLLVTIKSQISCEHLRKDMDLATFCPCKCHQKECKQRALLHLLLLPGSQGTDLLNLILR